MDRSITLTEKDIERFWSHVDEKDKDDCWEWQAYKSKKGYGSFGVKRNILLAHRISWIIANGQIPKGKIIMHKCDNPPCVNPEHLFCGTPMDNMMDKMRKGRYKKGKIVRGESHPISKLKKEDIPKIRNLYDQGISTHKIGKRFGVNSKTIWFIGKRIAWSHIE